MEKSPAAGGGGGEGGGGDAADGGGPADAPKKPRVTVGGPVFGAPDILVTV